MKKTESETIIETARVKMRRFSMEDVPTLYKILSDPITMKFWPQPFDLEGTKNWIQLSLKGYESTGLGRFALIHKESGQLIGHCGFLRTMINGKLENDLGYILDKNYWGQGLASEAAAACLKFGTETLGLNRIVANMEDLHVESRKVAEKIGMRFELTFINPRNRNLNTWLLVYPPGEPKGS